MKATRSLLLSSILALAAVSALAARSSPVLAEGSKDGTAPLSTEVTLDLGKAVELDLPEIGSDLKPERFKTKDGRGGWAIRIPGNRPIATPAYADGLIFVGGGYGSHEFYALDARTGAVVWQMQTGDDGPTAAVVEDGLVAFNTESCTVIVAEAKTGKLVWQEWLGDPLMSQPAISQGKLYIAYPSGQRGKGEPGHALLCADLKTGKHIWEQKITGDVISAPVIDGDQVFFTCFDGTSFCLKAQDGAVVWKKENAGTSAPVVSDGQVVLTKKETRDGSSVEGIQRLTAEGEAKDARAIAAGGAGYLDRGKGGGVALGKDATEKLDAGVGFAQAPQAASLMKADSHLGVATVAGGWAYQGSRAACGGGQIMNAQGRYLNCVSSKDGKMAWRAHAKMDGVAEAAQVFSPPALGKKNLYLASGLGHLVAVSQKDGAPAFMYATKQPMVFQPALALGNVYAGTSNGLLICLETGDEDASGWTAWGGNAQHNKKG